MQPLHELLEKEASLDDLIRHLDKVYYYFSQYSMNMSCWEETPVEREEVLCLYWIERLKQMFEEMKN